MHRLLPLLLLTGCEVFDAFGIGKDDDTYLTALTTSTYTPGYTTWAYTYYCFTADTPVKTPRGDRPIADLAVGDPVIAWDELGNRPVVRQVTDLHRRTAPGLVVLDLDGTRIETTDEHPFYDLAVGAWVPAGELSPGDRLARLVDGELEPSVVRRIARIDEPTPVFNLTVGGPEHTYFAGSVLVHNKTGTGTASTWSYGTTSTTTTGDADLRVVHLAWDAGTVEVIADGQSFATLFTGGNSDALATSGYDYSPVAIVSGGDVYLDFRDPVGTTLFSALPILQSGHRYTAVGMGAVQPPAMATWPATVVVADDGVQTGTTTPTGHQITVWHAMTDARVFDLWFCEGVDDDGDGVLDPCDTSGSPDHPGLTFGQWSAATEVATADQVVTIAETGTATAIQSFHLTGALQDWSYLYLGSDPANPTGPPIAHHHALGQALSATPTLN